METKKQLQQIIFDINKLSKLGREYIDRMKDLRDDFAELENNVYELLKGNDMDIRQKIKQVAESYIGITEIPQNRGWHLSITNPEFQEKMIKRGWRMGWAWCCLFAELVYMESYEEKEIKRMINKLFTPNSQATFLAFKESPEFKVSMTPEVGDLVFWKTGKISGHTGIVIEVLNDVEFRTVEGNQRDKVNRKIRKTTTKGKRFELLGFVKPI